MALQRQLEVRGKERREEEKHETKTSEKVRGGWKQGRGRGARDRMSASKTKSVCTARRGD